MTEISAQEPVRCNGLLADLKTQERKLMQKDYRDEISAELFSEESLRIKRERADATAIVKRLSIRHDELASALALVLAILSHDIYDLYLRARPTQRRFINQAIFEALWISHEDVERSDLKSPYDAIRVVSEATRIVNEVAAGREAEQIEAGVQGAENGKAPEPDEASGALALGSISNSMVDLEGRRPNRKARVETLRLALIGRRVSSPE